MGFEEIYDILIGIIILLSLGLGLLCYFGCLCEKNNKTYYPFKHTNELDDENPKVEL